MCVHVCIFFVLLNKRIIFKRTLFWWNTKQAVLNNTYVSNGSSLHFKILAPLINNGYSQTLFSRHCTSKEVCLAVFHLLSAPSQPSFSPSGWTYSRVSYISRPSPCTAHLTSTPSWLACSFFAFILTALSWSESGWLDTTTATCFRFSGRVVADNTA